MRPYRRFFGLALLAGSCFAAPFLGACSMSFPIASLMPAGDDVTGSMATVPFGALLDEEDRRREKAALATALDPQGNGSPVHWENPKSGDGGSIKPMSQTFSSDGKICRAFEASVKTPALARTMGGGACTVAAGDWIVKDVRKP